MVICLSQQHATIMDFSRLYEVSNSVDEHRDMRLDIDSMTYEVLNAASSVHSHHALAIV
jgi:E3 ubiquitin-protein ligase RNF38/44